MRTNEKISLWIPQKLKSSLCHIFVTLDEIEQFLERPNLIKTHSRIKKLNSFISIKDIICIV